MLLSAPKVQILTLVSDTPTNIVQLQLCEWEVIRMSVTQFYQFRWRINKDKDRTQIGSSAVILVFSKLIILYLLFLYFKRGVRTLWSTDLQYKIFLFEICCYITETELCWNNQQHVVTTNRNFWCESDLQLENTEHLFLVLEYLLCYC